MLRLSWARTDRHRTLAPLAATGLLLAGVLAIVGLPPFSLHGPLHRLGVMDPLCGLTRGTVALLRGQPGRAWAFNPASLPLVAAAVLVLVRALVGGLTGRWVNLALRPTRTAWTMAALVVLALWVHQQAHASLLC